MFVGPCLSTGLTLGVSCGTKPLLLVPQRLAPGTVPDEEPVHVLPVVVFGTQVQEKRPPRLIV